MIWMTGLKPWADVSFSPAGLSGVDVSGIGIVQEIQNLPHYSDESKINQEKMFEENPLTNKVSQSPVKGSFPYSCCKLSLQCIW